MKHYPSHPLSHDVKTICYYYLSHEGESAYIPATRISLSADGSRKHSIVNTPLPRSSSTTTESTENSSASLLSSAASSETAFLSTLDVPAKDAQPFTQDNSHFNAEVVPRLGLPKDWTIYTLSRGRSKPKNPHLHIPSFRRAFYFDDPSDGHGRRPSKISPTTSDFRDIDLDRIDYSRPLSFELATETAHAAESFLSHPSSLDLHKTLRSPVRSPPILPELNLGGPFRIDAADFVAEVTKEQPHPIIHDNATVSSPANIIYPFHPDIPHRPDVQFSRPLPREFSDEQLHEIRRRTRHTIRVVTRASIGLTATLALSGVAPQLLIAAAINAYCLGRGVHRLRQQLDFLKNNELKVKKRDSKPNSLSTSFLRFPNLTWTYWSKVVLAIAEGVAVKVAFMAITINHDDFIVVTHQLVGSHTEAIVEQLHEHPLPGIRALNEYFITPMEHVQQCLGIPTMAERAGAADHQVGVGTVFGDGSWDGSDVELLLKNIFVVGGVQAIMEQGVDVVQDHFGRAVVGVKERIEGNWRWSREKGWGFSHQLDPRIANIHPSEHGTYQGPVRVDVKALLQKDQARKEAEHKWLSEWMNKSSRRSSSL